MKDKELIPYDNPMQDDVDIPTSKLVGKTSSTYVFKSNQDFTMNKHPFIDKKITLQNSFVNNYGGISWIVEIDGECCKLWDGTLQA